MGKFLYPIYKLKIENYKKWWLYYKKANGGKTLSELIGGFSHTLENTISGKFVKFEIKGHSEQETTSIASGDEYDSPSPEHEQPIESAGDNGCITEKIINKNWFENINWYRNNSDWLVIDNSTNRIRSEAFQIQGGKTYILSGLPEGITFINARTYTEWNGANTADVTKSGNSFTLGNDVKYIHLLLGGENFTDETKTLLKNSNIMVELGSTASDYVVHEEQTYTIPVQAPFRSIGDVRDCFVKVNGEWKERHNISRVVFDGTENWIYEVASGNINRFNIKVSDMLDNTNVISSHFRNKLANEYGCIFNTVRLYICANYSSVTDFNNWLSNNNVEVIYELATPVDLPCTAEQIDILENLPKSYAGQTNVYSIDEVEAYIQVQYYYKEENQ